MMRWRKALTYSATGLVAVIVLGLAAVGVGSLTASPTVGYWRELQSLERYRGAHDELLAQLGESPETRDVETTHGTVRTLTWSTDADGDPVLLIPGRSSGSAQWVENLPGWIGQRPIIAVDPLGDAGFSTQRLPFADAGEQADSYAEVLDALGVEAAHVVGHSFGGAQAATLASRRPGLMSSVTLFEPVLVADALPVSTFLWSTALLLPLPQGVRDRALAEIGGTTVDAVRSEGGAMTTLIDAASSGYAAALPTPRELDDDAWRAIDAPLRVDLGGAHSLSGPDAAERLRTLLPDAEVTVWDGGTHSLPMDESERFARLLPEFWVEAETEAEAES